MKLSGCVIEDQVNYAVHNLDGDNQVPTTQESQQTCAEHCASTEGGRYWTYNKNNKECWIKTKDSDRRYHADVISGSRACGLSNRKISARLASVAVVASKPKADHPPKLCADRDPSTICVVESSPMPWLAIYLGSRARVDKVEIRNIVAGTRNGNDRQATKWANKVWVADSLPSSGAHIVNILIFFRPGALPWWHTAGLF